jgi:hypothetical protein
MSGPTTVIPAQAGIQSHEPDGRTTLDPRLRGDDGAERRWMSATPSESWFDRCVTPTVSRRASLVEASLVVLTADARPVRRSSWE